MTRPEHDAADVPPTVGAPATSPGLPRAEIAPRRPRLHLVVALAVGALAAIFVYDAYVWRDLMPRPSDFAQLWMGAREVLAGRDPYLAVGPGRALEWHTSLVYPMPAILLALPFAPLSMHAADAAFSGVSAGVLTYALVSRRPALLVGLLSYPVLVALRTVQWSPLLTAALLLPMLGPLVVGKPHLGLAIAAYRTTRWMAAGVAGLVLVSFVVMPDWPVRWLHALQAPTSQVASGPAVRTMYAPLVSRPLGFLALLALLRWRRPEARLLVVLACVPQTMLAYELVPLLLVARTPREAGLYAGGSWGVAIGSQLMARHYRSWSDVFAWSGNFAVWCVVLPMLLIVLRRPNEGTVPMSWRVRCWLRGTCHR